jgi:hypothetical protein
MLHADRRGGAAPPGRRRILAGGSAIARSLPLLVTLLACACAPLPPRSQDLSAQEAPGEEDLQERWPGRPRIESRPLAIALFPIQLVPDVLANAVVALVPGSLWPLQYLLYPISVPYWGITDAWEGRPFWDPSALYE